MYKIGEFSLLNKVTIKTLRYYNEIGLFIPKVIDKYTGYRYYDEDQLEEFNKISKYKELGFSLEDIKKLKNNNDESIINKQIEELTLQGKDIDNKLSILKNMIRGDSMNVSFKPYREKYKIGKRVILKNREDLENRLIEVKNILDKNNIKYDKPVMCNFEIGYEYENIDAFVGYLVDEDIEVNDLETIDLSKNEKYLIIKCDKNEIEDAYSKMVSYAHDNKIQIRGFFTEVYNNNEIEIYVDAFDLNEINDDYIHYLNEFNKNIDCEIDEELIGKYRIIEILPDLKYMYNKNKQKSNLDTKYKILELLKDGSTNYDNIKWNKDSLLVNYDNNIIPMKIYKYKHDNKEYIVILMNETMEYYKTARPIQYLYEKI